MSARKPTQEERQAHMDFLSKSDGIATSVDHFLGGVDYARSAVAELIEAATEMNRLAKGPAGGVSQADKKAIVTRVDEALAKATGAA